MNWISDIAEWMTRTGAEQVWLLATAIFLSRVLDQSLSTFRTISIIRGFGLLAALIGFFEVLIWINVAGQVIRNLQHWYLAVVYAAGFAAGNTVGIYIESRVAIGNQMVRVISRRGVGLAQKLWDMNYAVVQLDGKTKSGDIDVLFIAEKRRNVQRLLRKILELDSEAIFTVEDIKQIGLRSRDPSVVLGEKLLSEVADWVPRPRKKKSRDQE